MQVCQTFMGTQGMKVSHQGILRAAGLLVEVLLIALGILPQCTHKVLLETLTGCISELLCIMEFTALRIL